MRRLFGVSAPSNNPEGLPAIPAVAAISAASTATAMAAASTAATTSSSAISAAAPAAATATLSLRPRFVHHQVSPAEILSVKRIYGLVGFFVVGDFDEGEAARLTRETVANQIHSRGSYTNLREPLVKLFLRRGKRKIPDIELLHQPTPSARHPLASLGARRRGR
jgi:hypothetical protein